MAQPGKVGQRPSPKEKMKLVVDSSILIDHMRGGLHWLDFLRNVDPNVTLLLPTIVLFELYAGKSARDQQVQKSIMTLVQKLQKVDLTEDIALEAGRIYREMNIGLQAPDYIIAATARRLDAQVLTLNKKHFERISGLVLYSSPN